MWQSTVSLNRNAKSRSLEAEFLLDLRDFWVSRSAFLTIGVKVVHPGPKMDLKSTGQD